MSSSLLLRGVDETEESINRYDYAIKGFLDLKIAINNQNILKTRKKIKWQD